MNLQRQIERYKKHGLLSTLIHLLKQFIHWKSNTVIFYEIDLEKTDFPKIEQNSEFTFLKLQHDDIAGSKYIGLQIPEKEALERFQKKNMLFAAVKNNLAVSQNWSEPYEADVWGIKLKIKLPESTIYTSRLYTISEYRGKGLATKTKLYMLKSLKDLGFRRTFLVTGEKNKVSQAVNRKFGYKSYQKVNFHRIFYFLRVFIVRECDTSRKNSILKIRKTDRKIWDMFSKCKAN